MRSILRLLFLILFTARAASAQVPIEIVHTFVPDEPRSARELVAGSDGVVYGASYDGGPANGPQVFRLTADGHVTIVRSMFAWSLLHADGMLYGITNTVTGHRAIFTMRVDGSDFELLHEFIWALDGVSSPLSLARAADGTIYGTADGGAFSKGVVFKLDPQRNLSILHDFTGGADGFAGFSLLIGSDGNLYGTTTTDSGLPAGPASVFRLTPDGTFWILHAFDCTADGVCRPGMLHQAPGGDLFGLAQGGIFRLTLGGALTKVCGDPGICAPNDFVVASDGNLYTIGSLAPGVVYRITPTGTVSAVYSLSATEGDKSLLALTLAPDDSVYAALGDYNNLSSRWGKIAHFTTGGTFSIVHQFVPGSEGLGSIHMTVGSDGAFYGTASRGGPFDHGTAFRVTADGAFALLHAFTDGFPVGVTEASDGNFYIPALWGGLFRMTPAGEVTQLLGLRSVLNVPKAASDGYLYGLGTSWSQSAQTGVYQTSLTGTVTPLWRPSSAWGDVWLAHWTPFAEAADGTLYGTTSGLNDGLHRIYVPGTVFRIPPDRLWVPTLHTFADYEPSGRLVVATDGNVYGFHAATFYRLTPDGVFTTIGTVPSPGNDLLQGADGDFYGTAGNGIYRMTAGGVVSLVHQFSSATASVGTLLQTPGGAFYGTVSDGGTASIFRFTAPAIMTLDVPGNNTTAAQPFYADGWAIDRTATTGPGVDAVHLWAFPAGGGTPTFVGAAEYFRPRSDVGAIYGEQFAASGYRLTVSGLTPGTYTLVAYAHSSETGTFNQWRAATITVTNRVSQPAMDMDRPEQNAVVPGRFVVAGWALDRSALEGAGVDAIHVYAFAASGAVTFLGVADYGVERPDVGNVFGAQFVRSGYWLTVGALDPGEYTLVVFARSTVSGTFFAQAHHITVRAGNPLMALDTPADGATHAQPFPLAGWAIDRDAPSGPGVDVLHVWAFPAGGGTPTFVGVASTGGARSDVGAIFGSQFTNSGYSLAVTGLAPGTYQIVVYAHSTVTGTFNQWRVVTVSVQ